MLSGHAEKDFPGRAMCDSAEARGRALGQEGAQSLRPPMLL